MFYFNQIWHYKGLTALTVAEVYTKYHAYVDAKRGHTFINNYN